MGVKTLKESSTGTDNNLNLVRLIAAFMVMYMHSLALCQANQEADLMYTLTFHKALSGQVGVDIFFVISGFLIYRSYERKNNVLSFLKARFLRIWPLLAAFILVTAFILGPAFTALTREEYFAGNISEYLLNLLFISGDNRLPGVFANHINKSSNGSIWTLQYEVICYLLVLVFVPLCKKYKKAIFALVACSAFVYLFFTYSPESESLIPLSRVALRNMGRLTMEFEIGAMYYIYSDKILLSFKYFLIAVAGIIVFPIFFDYEIAFAIFGAYIVMYIGFGYYGVSKLYNKVGDISYGVYVLSFFVQQRLIDILGKSPDGYQVLRMNPYQNLWLTTVIVLPLSFFSWHLFEKQLLKLK